MQRPRTTAALNRLAPIGGLAIVAILAITDPVAAQNAGGSPLSSPIVAQGGVWEFVGSFLTEFSSQLWGLAFVVFFAGLLMVGFGGTDKAVVGRTLIVGAVIFAVVLLLAGQLASFFQSFGNVGEGIGNGSGFINPNTFLSNYIDALHQYLVR